MRNKNSVKQFGRTHSHRKMMFANMVTSLFAHERIVTTKHYIYNFLHFKILDKSGL